jgi:serine/threonine protein kinase
LERNFDVANAVIIGTGSLGDVLLAKDLRQGLRVAVKVISLKKLRAVSNFKDESRQEEARVRREVQAMLELNHPNIVKILDVQASRVQLPMLSSEPPYICIVMEYVSDSQPLSVAIRKSRLGTPQVFDIIRQIGSALAQMHDQGLVHRDVWSENVLLTRSGHAVLIDLGCTESVCGPAAQDDLNIPYMSPEAAHGERQRSSDDCFSFGLLITEMVTGRFVCDRIGRTDMPISLMPEKLKDAIVDSSLSAGGQIGILCSGLLELQVNHRLTMRDAMVLCSGQGHSVRSSAVRNRSLTPLRSQRAAFHAQKSSHVLFTPDSTKSQVDAVNVLPEQDFSPTSGHSSPQSSLAPGQLVWYQPRTEGLPKQMAVLMGRLKGQSGWQIQLVASRLVKDITDVEAWRLTSTGIADGIGSPGSPGSPGFPRSHGSFSVPNTGTRSFAAERLSFGGSRESAGASDACPHPLHGRLACGQNVLYRARCDGELHKGVISACTLGGWRITLHTGMIKDVELCDAWRIMPVAVSGLQTSPSFDKLGHNKDTRTDLAVQWKCDAKPAVCGMVRPLLGQPPSRTIPGAGLHVEGGAILRPPRRTTGSWVPSPMPCGKHPCSIGSASFVPAPVNNDCEDARQHDF